MALKKNYSPKLSNTFFPRAYEIFIKFDHNSLKFSKIDILQCIFSDQNKITLEKKWIKSLEKPQIFVLLNKRKRRKHFDMNKNENETL